jgi:hypothetical protein
MLPQMSNRPIKSRNGEQKFRLLANHILVGVCSLAASMQTAWLPQCRIVSTGFCIRRHDCLVADEKSCVRAEL